MFLVAGGRWTHLIALGGTGIGLAAILALARPYVRERIMIFLDPSSDPLGAGYQIQQSLIAIGSGKLFGRGMGQSVQKFNYLPEPIGDSIFAVFAEEWGFFGALIFLTLLAAFIFRGLRIASMSKNRFGMFATLGLITLIGVQSLINIASMIGIFPLSGIPLTFVSHGGTALLFSLIAVGIVLNISKGEEKRGVLR
jgi:cell division protein FtsW